MIPNEKILEILCLLLLMVGLLLPNQIKLNKVKPSIWKNGAEILLFTEALIKRYMH
jgi:hypothetical protein